MNEHYVFEVCFAGVNVTLDVCHLQTKLYCRDFMRAPGEKSSVLVRTTEEDIIKEWKSMLRNTRYQPEFVNTLPNYYFEIFALHRKVADALLSRNVLVYHGSCVSMDGQGFILSADSGVGKSTFARKWAAEYTDRAFILNDDKPFLSLEKDGCRVFGSPWNGKHHLGRNADVPLKTILFLERGNENLLQRMQTGEVLQTMCMQVFRPERQEDFDLAMELLRKISRDIPCYRYVFDIDKNPVGHILIDFPKQD